MDPLTPAVGDADLAVVGSILAEPARAKILLALTDGRALPASLLATEAGVAASTASHHLARLVESGLVDVIRSGRYRYFSLSGPEAATLIEAVARVAPSEPITSLRQGTRAYAMRFARRCYDHLAGRVGVAIADAVIARAPAVPRPGAGTAGGNQVRLELTSAGALVLSKLGVVASSGDPVRGCLDWTERREHIAGPIGRQILERLLASGWTRPVTSGRAMILTPTGRTKLADLGLTFDSG